MAAPPVADLYRPTNAVTQRHLAPLLPPTTTTTSRPSIAEILGTDDKTYNSRVYGKSILIDGDASSSGEKALSDLVVGKKRNRGNPSEKLKARREAEYAQLQRDSTGAQGTRRVRQRLKQNDRGGILHKGKLQNISYQAVLPLHYMHTAYLTSLLSLPPLPPISQIPSSSTNPHATLPPNMTCESIQAKILKSDFTGAYLTVLAARNASLVSLSGIILEETASTFRMIGEDDTVRIIPKNGSQFRLFIPAYAPSDAMEVGTEQEKAEKRDMAAAGEPDPAVDWAGHLATCPRIEITILGTAFGYRSADRAGRKFRPAQGHGGGSGWGEEWVRGEWTDALLAVEADIAKRSGPSKSAAINTNKPSIGGRKAGAGAASSQSGHHLDGAKKRKRGKSRRKDLPAWGRLDVP